MTTLVMPLAASHRPVWGPGSLEGGLHRPAMPQRPSEGSSRLKGHAHRASHHASGLRECEDSQNDWNLCGCRQVSLLS
jgi:hypothetical protein